MSKKIKADEVDSVGRYIGPLSVAEAKKLRVCRICRIDDKPSPGNPLVLNYGKEYAHEKCLKRNDQEGKAANE